MVIPFKTSVIRKQTAAKGRLCYELICKTDAQSNEVISYGVKLYNALFGSAEQVEILDVTPDLAYAIELFELLVCFLVTPITLKDVIDDFLYEKYR